MAETHHRDWDTGLEVTINLTIEPVDRGLGHLRGGKKIQGRSATALISR